MRWLILLVSAIFSGGFGGCGAGGESILSVGTRGTTLGGYGVSCSSTLGSDRVFPPVGYPVCSGTLGA